MVEVYGLEERLDRRRGLPLRHVTAAALLVEATETRVLPLEGFKSRQGFRGLPEEALCDGRDEQRVALPGRCGKDRLGGGQRLAEPVLAQHFAQARTRAGGGRCGVGREDRFHVLKKEADLSGPP